MTTGNFFRVDRRIWAAACELGMNPAVAYLVLAQGTNANNRSTRWSITSLKKHAGVTWERGKTAIEQLIESGLVRYAKEHTRPRPRYELPTWQELLPFVESRLQTDDRCAWCVYEEIKAGKQPRTKPQRAAAENLLSLGLVQNRPTGSTGICNSILTRRQSTSGCLTPW